MWKDMHHRLAEIFSNSCNDNLVSSKSGDGSDWKRNMSGIEILANQAAKYAPNECLLMSRVIQGATAFYLFFYITLRMVLSKKSTNNLKKKAFWIFKYL